ncbi:tyrosinase family oxidase copper chaperone [Streptomyces sp. NPDC002138]|uniref:apotyrosinase chaperone MelC1 n=1 Tax=Streptomyces sp. NPDC002138 TaxID=3154410 RepID=UPI00331D2F33
MKTITRRQALAIAAGAVTVAGATTAAVLLSDTDTSSPAAEPASGAPGSLPTGTIDEVYEGRRIEIGLDAGGHHGGHGSPGLPTVRIDGKELHLMRNADNSWLSVVNHYQTFPDPVSAARAAVLDLQGAALVALDLKGGTA